MSSLIEKYSNIIWEYKLGITTRGLANVNSSNEEQIHYGTIPYKSIFKILDELHIQPSDVFVDLGCGKGRVVCCAGLRKVSKIIGVEYLPSLADEAKSNINKLRVKQSHIEIQNIEAQKFDYSSGTVFYMFHPFGPKTMREVLDELKKGLQKVPRDIRIVYVNPVHNSVLKEQTWLAEKNYWNPNTDTIADHEVAWWKNKEYK